MRKRATNSKPTRNTGSAAGGRSNARTEGGSPFKRAKPETESRFSKPSIKKSSLKFNSQESKPARSRPNFDHEKPRNERPRFGDSDGGFRKDKPFEKSDRFNKDRGFQSDRKPFRKSDSDSARPFKSRGQDESAERRPFSERSEKPSFERERNFDRGEKPKFERGEKPRFAREEKPRFERGEKPRFDRDEKPRFERGEKLAFDRPKEYKPAFGKRDAGQERPAREPRNQPERGERGQDTDDRSGLDRRVGRFESAPRYNFGDFEKKNPSKKKEDSEEIRLNRYIANAGICSRREADDLISSGQISVNGKTVTEMGYKVRISDVVKYGKKALNPEKMVYILINKPKDYITTTDDPEERKTVLDLIKGACIERIYPVGRLDRNTTGLLLMTNDGELAEKLTHPSSGIKKIYQAELDKPITTEDFEALQHGVELEDGFIRPDEVGLVTPDAMVVGLEIHSGRNRIVRRMFEHLGYTVEKLDRTVFAGLNKKDLPRGKWRFLSEKEVIKLKYML